VRSAVGLLDMGMLYFSKSSIDAHRAVDYIIAEMQYALEKQEIVAYSSHMVFEHELLNFKKLSYGEDPAQLKETYISLVLQRYDAKKRDPDVILVRMPNEMNPPPQMPPAPETTPPALLYRSVGVRFVALLIDVIVAGIIASVFASPLRTPVTNSVKFTSGSFNISTTANPLAGVGSVIAALVVLFYFTLLLGAYGQTVGMVAMKIKVVREDGSKISYVDALVRSLLLIIDAIPWIIPFLLGAILIWTSDTKQRIGDRVAHTVVITA